MFSGSRASFVPDVRSWKVSSGLEIHPLTRDHPSVRQVQANRLLIAIYIAASLCGLTNFAHR